MLLTRVRLSLAVLVAIATTMGACAPTHRSTEVVDVGTDVHRRWEPRASHVARASVSGHAVVVTVTSVRACIVTEREVRKLEDREDRGVSLGLVIPGGVLVAGGVVLLANPGPSCAEQNADNPDGWGGICVVDQKKADQTLGGILVLSGLVLAAGGVSTIKHEAHERTELGEPRERRVPACSEGPGRGLVVTLRLEDGTELLAQSDEAGVATIAVPDDLWIATDGVLVGTLHVDGEPVERVRLIGERETTQP